MATANNSTLLFFSALSLLALAGCGSANGSNPPDTQPAPTAPAPSITSTWTPVSTAPIIVPTQAWEGDNVNDGSTLRVGETYYRFYCSGNDQMTIGFATSRLDQFPLVWEKHAHNPIIRPTDIFPGIEHGAVCAPRVIAMPDGSFRMYAHAYDGTHDRVYIFTSVNFPTQWRTDGAPILSEGGPNDWDGHQVQSQAIIPAWETPDGLWHMFYIGYDAATYRGGHAVSADGVRWTKDAHNPVMTPGGIGWRSGHVGPLSWYKDGATFHLLAQGYDGREWALGFYTTTDFSTFTANDQPAFTATPGTWDASGIEGTDIMRDADGSLWAFYLGSNVPNEVQGGGHYRMGIAKIEN